jgi:hypothetical protein
LSLSKDLMHKSPHEETFSMDTRRSLRYVIMRTGETAGSARSARRERPAGTSRGAQAARGIVLPALVLASLGTAGIASHAQASAHRPVVALAAGVRADAARTCTMSAKPAVTRTPQIPWMFAVTVKPQIPWMFAIGIKPQIPWMFAVVNRAAGTRAAAGTTRNPAACAHTGTKIA